MKNKKFLKAIAAITLSASAALGAFGLTACGGGHSHSFKWESDATEHWKVCDCGDEEDGTRANHDFTDGDCICGAKKTRFGRSRRSGRTRNGNRRAFGRT